MHVQGSMQWRDPYSPHEGTKRVATESVVVPHEHEGIGRALRSAYLPRTADTPRDLWDLLDQLN